MCTELCHAREGEIEVELAWATSYLPEHAGSSFEETGCQSGGQKKSRSGKSGRSGWAAYRVQKENQRLAQENQINAFREYFNSEAPPLKKEQALVPVKQEELQAPPALNEAFLAAALNEEPSDLQDAATQTPKNWAKELKSANLKIVKTRPRYINGCSPLDSPPPRRFRRAPSVDPERCTFPPQIPCRSSGSHVDRPGCACTKP